MNQIDFKLKLSEEKLYYDPDNQILYNRNEAGNYAWAYYLTLHGLPCTQGALAQAGSIVQYKRLDERWDHAARWAGVKAAYERMGRGWLYSLVFEIFGVPKI